MNDEFKKARAFCVLAHDDQYRDGGDPYWIHPIAVANILMDYGVEDQDTLAAAYLHDVLEDTEVTEDLIFKEFGSKVRDIVVELTRENSQDGDFSSKVRYCSLLKGCMLMGKEANAIKTADRLHNLRDMDTWGIDKMARYAKETLGLLEVLKPWALPRVANVLLNKARSIL